MEKFIVMYNENYLGGFTTYDKAQEFINECKRSDVYRIKNGFRIYIEYPKKMNEVARIISGNKTYTILKEEDEEYYLIDMFEYIECHSKNLQEIFQKVVVN